MWALSTCRWADEIKKNTHPKNTTPFPLCSVVREHSRLTRMWSAYDSLTNSFAVEGIRYMLNAAARVAPSDTATIKRWSSFRSKIIAGLHSTAGLEYRGVETDQAPIYAEFRGHVNGYGADSNRQNWTAGDPAPLVPGMSWVQLAGVNNLLANLSNAGGTAALLPLDGLGIKPERVDATFATYARGGSFLWVNEDIELSALVQTTNVNVTRVRAPPYTTAPPPPPPPPFPKATCAQPLTGKDALLIASGHDAFEATMPSHGACCLKCETAGLATCGAWFYRSTW